MQYPSQSQRSDGRQAVVKRAVDLLLAVTGLVVLAPLLLAIAIRVRHESPGPALFRQPREGINGRLFEMLKFRTMYAHASDIEAQKLTTPDDSRVTLFGRFLRTYSLDELPQLVNVARGEMSLVGPRPLPSRFQLDGLVFEDHIPCYAGRRRARPGITGWAQVNGLRGTPTDRDAALAMVTARIELDNVYIDSWSLLFDLRIIALTIVQIIHPKNVY